MAGEKYVIKGATVKYGIGTADFPTTYGLVQSGNLSSNAQFKDYRNTDGSICTTVISDTEVWSANFSIILSSTATLPAIGVQITVDGKKFLVESISKDWSNEDAQRVTINARFDPSATTSS